MESFSPQRLDGWKAIAAYLGRDERTAQRWRARGLPVHAVPGGKRGTVFAYSGEIDEWLTREAPDDLKGDLADAPLPLKSEDAPPPATSSHQPWLSSRVFRSRSLVGVALLSGGVLALVLGSVSALRPADDPRVVRAEVAANGLVAWTADGQVAFSISSGDLIPPNTGSSTIPTVVASQDLVVTDFDGDGSADVLAVLGFVNEVNSPRLVSDEVHYYSDTGRLRWRYRVQRRLRFGGRDFDGPWRILDRVVTRDADGRSQIFLAVVHDVWWPSFVISLDADGTERMHYVNSGHLYQLEHLQTPGRDLLIATGVNNEYESAHVAAIDPAASPTVSPQSHAKFTCEGCLGGPPHTYILFPRTELSRLRGRPYNLGLGLSVTPSEVRVSIQEFTDPVGRSHYRLSRGLDAQSFAMSDAYWSVHQLLEQKGEISHPAALCPERVGRHVRAWTRDGWQEIWVAGERPSE